MANARIKRDLDDRLEERVMEVKARTTASEEDIQRRDRLEAFRDKWQNSALPDLPKDALPGFHLCWLSTTNTYDGIEFKSALELYCYKRLKDNGFDFQYESESITLVDGFRNEGVYFKCFKRYICCHYFPP